MRLLSAFELKIHDYSSLYRKLLEEKHFRNEKKTPKKYQRLKILKSLSEIIETDFYFKNK